MSTTTKLDRRRRGVFPPLFQPGDVFLREMTGLDTVTFKLVKPAEVPLVKMRMVKGRPMGAEVKVDPSVIAAAIRADRDSR